MKDGFESIGFRCALLIVLTGVIFSACTSVRQLPGRYVSDGGANVLILNDDSTFSYFAGGTTHLKTYSIGRWSQVGKNRVSLESAYQDVANLDVVVDPVPSVNVPTDSVRIRIAEGFEYYSDGEESCRIHLDVLGVGSQDRMERMRCRRELTLAVSDYPLGVRFVFRQDPTEWRPAFGFDLFLRDSVATRAADLAGLGGTIATVAVGGPEHPFKFELIDGDTVAVGRAHAIRRYL